MPDNRPDHDLDNLRLTASVLVTTSVITLVGALLSYVTGDELGRGRGHMDATLVLLVVGSALAVASLIVFVERKDRASAREARRSDWE
jgi:hypothetical protein